MTSTLAPSGLSAVDDRWGGLRVGGAYLLVGRADVGRAGLALQIARAAVEAGGRCLIISPRTPEALAADGRAVGLDLGDAHRTGRLRMLRTPDAATLAAKGSDGLAKAYADLARLVESDRPDRVVIEDLTPLVQFDSFDALSGAFAGLVDALEAIGATLVVGLGEPANDASVHLLQLVGQHVDGTIRLHSENGQRRLVLYRHREPEAETDTESTEPLTPPPAEMSVAPTVEMAHAPSDFAPSRVPPAPSPASTSVAPPAPTPSAPTPPAPAPLPTEMAGPSAPQAPAESGVPSGDGVASGDGAASADGAPPRTAVVPPPPAEAALMEPTDAFAADPAERFLKQGYMIDSAQPGTTDVVPLATSEPEASPVPPFAGALAQAFASRADGGQFLVVAVRMEPAVAESAYFASVADGLRQSLRPTDLIQVDAAALRAAVLLPDGSPEASKALFAGLQSHLRATLAGGAEDTLRAVGAVSIPDGQPFGTAEELMNYVFNG